MKKTSCLSLKSNPFEHFLFCRPISAAQCCLYMPSNKHRTVTKMINQISVDKIKKKGKVTVKRNQLALTVAGRWDASYMDFMLVYAWKPPDGSHKSRPNSLTELFGKKTTQIYGTMGFMDLNIQYPIICKLYIYKNQSLRLNVRTLLHFTYSCSVEKLHKQSACWMRSTNCKRRKCSLF